MGRVNLEGHTAFGYTFLRNLYPNSPDSVVYATVPVKGGPECVFKIFLDRPGSGDPLSRSEREVTALAHLDGHRAPQLIDAGILEGRYVGRMDNVPYVVIQKIDGQQILQTFPVLPLEEREPENVLGYTTAGAEGLTPTQVSEITLDEYLREAIKVIDTAQAVHDVHTRGITHGDLKPLSVMYGPDGAVLIDFERSKIEGRTYQTSAPNAGTHFYSEARQESFGTASMPADMYALGCMIHDFAPFYIGAKHSVEDFLIHTIQKYTSRDLREKIPDKDYQSICASVDEGRFQKKIKEEPERCLLDTIIVITEFLKNNIVVHNSNIDLRNAYAHMWEYFVNNPENETRREFLALRPVHELQAVGHELLASLQDTRPTASEVVQTLQPVKRQLEQYIKEGQANQRPAISLLRPSTFLHAASYYWRQFGR